MLTALSPRELSSVIVTAVYIPPQADTKTTIEELHSILCKLETIYPQKPWIDCSIRAKLKARTTTFNHGKATGNMAEYKQCSFPSVRQSNKQSVSIETKWSRNSAAQTWDVCGRVYRQSQITKRKSTPSQASTSCSQKNWTTSLLAFRTIQSHWHGPLPKHLNV